MVRDPRIRLQSGALPYRIEKNGKIRILLVTTGPGKRWGIPKGTAEPYLTLSQNAEKEAFEEAGVTGEISPHSAGMYRANKRNGVIDGFVEVWVYLLKVDKVLDDWPEKARRRTKWVGPKEAAATLREPLLAKLCLDLKRAEP
ncbi:MAG TPA: NUDIX hydrolase [Stellaceae bacterium]|nr:NUDIX hydrolase [Stellaceae bacterium]